MLKIKPAIEVMLLLGVIAPSRGQTAPSVRQTAKQSSCSNIVALAGAKVDCSNLTPAQKKALANIPSILKLAIENEDYLDAILKKLDEMSASQPSVVINSAPGGFATSGGTLVNPQVNNYGPRIPTLLGREIIEKDSRGVAYPATDDKGHPLTNVRFYADSSWDDPRIAVMCDRPCLPYQAVPYQASVLMSPTFLGGSVPSEPNLVVFLFATIKPMSADTYYVLTVSSLDSNPVKILKVAPFVGKISPH